MNRQDNKQVKRLFSLPFAPSGDAAKDSRQEFERILDRARCEGRWLESVVNGLMDSSQRFPAPAEMVQALNETPRAETQTGPNGCGYCEDGWLRSKRQVTIGGMDGYEADFSGLCSCARGQWKARGERQITEERMQRSGGRR